MHFYAFGFDDDKLTGKYLINRWSFILIDRQSDNQVALEIFFKMTWQRARQPNQKAERIEAILESAAKLFDQKDLSEISMRDVAAQAGLSKASLYSYFKTKEEVFATLFLQESENWFSFVEPKLRRLRTPNAHRVAKVLTDALRENQRFCRLTTVLASVLERNMSIEFIYDFKSELNSSLGRVISALQIALPGMTDDAGIVFLYQHQSLIAGLWPLTHPSTEMMEVLADEKFQSLRVDFFKLFQQTLEQLMGHSSQ